MVPGCWRGLFLAFPTTALRLSVVSLCQHFPCQCRFVLFPVSRRQESYTSTSWCSAVSSIMNTGSFLQRLVLPVHVWSLEHISGVWCLTPGQWTLLSLNWNSRNPTWDDWCLRKIDNGPLPIFPRHQLMPKNILSPYCRCMSWSGFVPDIVAVIATVHNTESYSL